MLGIAVKAIQILFCLFLLFISSAYAKQVSFSKQPQEDSYLFNYQWLDHDSQSQSLSFSLTKAALFERFRMLRPYQGEYAQKTIMRSVKKKLRKEPLKGAQAFFLPQDGKVVIQIKGLEDKNVALAYQKVQEIEKRSTEQYFKKNYYQHFVTHDEVFGIKINHARIANDSVADFKVLKPLILEKVSIKNIRKVTNYVLSFVQNIPYATLDSRVTSSGAGFNPPAKLLWENQGDCDSKVTLTATILRALMPRISMAMVFIDQHAFIGIAIPAKAGEMSIEHEGVNYLLAEPTGPALYKLGKLAPESELAINQERYVAEAYHSDGSL